MHSEEWIKLWVYLRLGCLVVLPRSVGSARPRFDTSTDMGLVLVPADAEVDSVIFRLRATDQDADFPLVFDITATVTPIVRVENLPCTLYNKICQANVILTKRLVPGRLHDFAVRVKDSKGDSNSMQATISVTNATTQRDKIFPHIPALIMVPEDAKPGKELDYILVRSNQWSGKPVYIELWQPKELFTIRQRQTPAETRGVITLIGELDFETQSMYTLKMYATDPYTEPRRDTRNIAGLHLVVIVQDVQDVPPIFTSAPPLTKINNTVQPGDVILRVHAEDGDKGVPREVTYGLVSEGNPFTPFFNISETTGEIILARPLEELTLITHVGAPVVLSVVAEEIRRSASEPPAQATVVEVGLLLGEPGNSPPFFENDNYVAWMDENAEPGSVVNFTEHYTTKVRDEDIGKAGVFALKLYNNNGTFEINPAVAERIANFAITVRDNDLIDYEKYKSLRFEIIAQEVGPATNLSTTVPCTIFIRDVNDNAPEFDLPSYEVTLSEDIPAGTRVVQVRATDRDTGSYGRIQYTRIIGPGNEGFAIDPDTGIITIAMGNTILDREMTASLQLSVEARDEDGEGLRGIAPLIVNLLDVNDNAPIFEKSAYEFILNEDLTNFTMPAIVKAIDSDAEPPNNEVRYELVHGNYENKFHLDEITGELFLREPINPSKVRRTRHNAYRNFATKIRNDFANVRKTFESMAPTSDTQPKVNLSSEILATDGSGKMDNTSETKETRATRKKRQSDDVMFTLTARAYDLGVPHLSGVTQVKVMKGPVVGARLVSFVVPGENPDPAKTAETLAAITGGRITVQDIRPYTIKDLPDGSGSGMPSLEGEKKSIVVARVEPNKGGTSLVDIERIRAALAANGVGVIGGGMPGMETGSEPKSNGGAANHNTNTYTNITSVHSEEVTVYRAENRLLFWLLIILGLLMLFALIALIVCCICPGCPFYMAPRKRRVHSSETLIARSDGRPKRHLHRKHTRLLEGSWPERKQAWSADPVRHNWQFNRRNQRGGGLASLPGDVHAIEREQNILEKAASLRLRDGPVPIYSTMEQMRRPDEERIYIEDVEGIRARGYVDMDCLRQHDPEHPQQTYVNQDGERIQEQPTYIREQHFYRDGNAEILRLETREQFEEGMTGQPVQRPQTLVIEQGQFGAYRNDGKEILLQRFIEDQKHRHASDQQDLHDSFQDIERRSVESRQRQKDVIATQAPQQQPRIVLLPERLEEDHRQHIEELGPEVQRLIIDHGSFDRAARFEPKDSQELIQGATLTINVPDAKVSEEKPMEQTSKQSVNLQHYTLHDLELARQNALLTRLLLGREGREIVGGPLIDSASYLETQSLPGQVAIATQTDRTASTQTELPNRSRSDNDESEEEAKIRKKLKYKKRYPGPEPRRIRTLWMKSPIEEEEMQYGSEKKTIFLRKKMRDVKDNRRISLEPDVLREISDSLDENAEPPATARRQKEQEDSTSKEEFQNEEDNGRLRESSSTEMTSQERIKNISTKSETKTMADDGTKKKGHREKRENIVEPSFRILEKEMSSLSKKISKLAGKKILQSSNGSETDSHETGRAKRSTATKKIDKKTETAETKKKSRETGTMKVKRSKSTHRSVVLDSPLIKERMKLHYKVNDDESRELSQGKKNQNISTGSSDFEEVLDKQKRSVPLVTHTERQGQAPTKSSYIKSTRHSRFEHKDLGKTSLVILPKKTVEGKETSDSGSKESMKALKSVMGSTRTKTDSSGTVEGQSGPASGSASSDSIKDKGPQKKERPLLAKMSVVKSSEGRTDSEQPNISPSSDNSKNKRLQLKEKVALDKKRASERPVVKTESERSTDAVSSDDIKAILHRKRTSMRDQKKAVVSSEEKIEIQRSAGKIGDSKQSSDSLESDNLNNQIQQRKARSTLNKPIAKDSSKAKTVSKLNGETPTVNIIKDEVPQKNSRPTLGRTSAVEIREGKSDSESVSDLKNAHPTTDEAFEQTQKCELDRKKCPEARDASSSDRLENEAPQTKETPILDRKSSPYEAASHVLLIDNLKAKDDRRIAVGDRSISHAGKMSDKVSHEEIPKEVHTKHLEESSLETTEAKMEEESPAARDPTVKVERKGVESKEHGTTQKTDAEVIAEAISIQTPHGSKQESFESIADRITKKGIIDFLSREAKDSVQALQSHYRSIDEETGQNKNTVLQTEALKNLSKENPKDSDKETTSQPVTLESHDHFAEWPKAPKDISEAVQRIEDVEKVVQQSEDGGTFSDNFDSFHEMSGKLKDLLTTQDSEDDIPYKGLQAESSEEDMKTSNITSAKEEMESSEKLAAISESAEMPSSPQMNPVVKSPKSEKPTSLTAIRSQSPDASSDLSPSRVIHSGATSVPDESTSTKTQMKATSDDSNLESERALHTNVIAEESTDNFREMQSATSAEIRKSDIKSTEEQTQQVPNVPPLNIQTADEKDGSSEELNDQKSKTSSPTFPTKKHDDETLKIHSQKEFGIADSLFADAKILTAPPSPKDMVSAPNAKTSPEKRLQKEEPKVDIPPINLLELSRAMLDDTDESDCSEASSKTMLTARPYGTPRHRHKSDSKDAKPAGTPTNSDTTTPTAIAVESPQSVPGPKKTDEKELSSEHVEQILSTTQMDLQPSTSVQVTQGMTSAQFDLGSAVLSPRNPSESSTKERKTSGEIRDKKSEIATKQVDTNTETTEKVQLSQIRQTKLPADSDGFASLPETGIPVKSSDNTTFLEGATLSERTIRLPGDRTNQDVEDFGIDTSETRTESLSFPVKIDIVKANLPKEPAAPKEVTKLGVMTIPKKSPSSEATEKATLKSTDSTDEHNVKTIAKGVDKGKTVPKTAPKTGLKGLIQKTGVSKEGLSKVVRKVTTPLVKTGLPKKNLTIKTLKEEPAKPTKQMAVPGHLADSRDSKQQLRPTEQQTEEQSKLLSRPDRIRRTWKKTKPPDEAVPGEAPKVEKVKKNLKEDDKTSISKKSTETSAKQEQLKGSGAKNVQDKDTKSEGAVMTSAPKVDKDMKLKKSLDGPDVSVQLVRPLDLEKQKVEINLQSAKEESGSLSIDQTDKLRVAGSIGSSRRLPETDGTEARESPPLEVSPLSSERPKLPEDTTMEARTSKERTIETDTIEKLPADTGKQELLIDDESGPTMVSENVKEIEEAAIGETLSHAIMDMALMDQEAEIRRAHHRSETKAELKQEFEDRTSDFGEAKSLKPIVTAEKTPSPRKGGKARKEMGVIESQSRYMEWYKLKREEMERKRQDRKQGDEEEIRPKWLRKSTRQRWIKVDPEDKKNFDPQIAETTPFQRKKIKPLVNVESEQLRAIVRQGRKLRRAQGEVADEPQIQIFAPENPPPSECDIPTGSRCHSHHHLIQHSEYKYEKMPSASFYLHPQTILDTATQTSSQCYEDFCPELKYSSLPTDSRYRSDIYDSSIIRQQPQQCVNKLRHGELLEKKSVFDIAYSEAAPSQLRSDSTTPPS